MELLKKVNDFNIKGLQVSLICLLNNHCGHFYKIAE